MPALEEEVQPHQFAEFSILLALLQPLLWSVLLTWP